jgi:hypothetical protein
MSRRFALLVLPLTLAACTSYRATGATQPTPERASRVEARVGELNVAVRALATTPTFGYCRARIVQGPVLRVEGDTVIFRELTRIDPVVAFDPACRSTGVARLVYTPGNAQVSEERTDMRRTVGAGILAAFVGFMLLGM